MVTLSSVGVCLLALLMVASMASGERQARRKLKTHRPQAAEAASGEAAPGELKVEVAHRPEECPRKTAVGDTVEVHYVGQLEDGQAFDSSLSRQGPLEVTLGQGQVIPGWEQGLLGMCLNEMRRLTVPPHLAYGDEGFPPTIPPRATLIFVVQLVSFKD